MRESREEYLSGKDALGKAFLEGSITSRDYLKGHAALLREILTTRAKKANLSENCAILAAGGFAREELFPYSDIDVLLLIDEAVSEEEKNHISTYLTDLWDLGLTVGASVRTPAEVAKDATTDVAFATNFLESEWLFGSKKLSGEAKEAFRNVFDARKFFREKELEMQQRRRKHGETPYELEPDLKESTGGLRDIQVILWCAKAAGFGCSIEELIDCAILTAKEAAALKSAQSTICDMRLRIQLMSGRGENRLLFDKELTLAKALGIAATSGLDAAELLMKRYYRNAHEVELLNEIAMRSIEERLFAGDFVNLRIKAIAPGILATGSMLDIEGENLLEAHPEMFLRIFLEFSRHQELRDFSARLMRLLYRVSIATNTVRFESPECMGIFREILTSRYGCSRCLQLMNRWGVLGKMIPEFDAIVGQMQHDLFHAYTVDQHTMLTIRYTRRFTHSSYAHEFPHCSQVSSEIRRPALLTLAALMHDIGKGRGGHHAEIGSAIAERFAASLGIDKEGVDYVRFLVREHLTMSRVAQKQDTSDPKVIEAFGKVVRNKARLDGLYLLTVADIRATNPKIWNSWKGKLLEDLYNKTLLYLKGEKSLLSEESYIREKKESAKKILLNSGLSSKEISAFFRTQDITYFMRNSAEDIAWHASVICKATSLAEPLVSVEVTDSGFVKVFFYLEDCAGLISKILRVFERDGLSVLEARIHTTRSGKVFDTFLAEDKRKRSNFEEFTPTLISHLKVSLESLDPLPEAQSGKLSRRSRTFPVKPIVDIEPDASGNGWLLQITCNDRMGLLYAISLCLARHRVNLVSAKITTLDERVEDVFLIDGDVLRNEETVLAIETELLEVLEDKD